MAGKLYWDSNAFLAWLQNEPGREAACRDTLDAAIRGEFLIVTSALTIAEVLWLRNGPKLGDDKAGTLNRFFQRSCIRVVNLDRDTAQRAQRLVWGQGIKPKDSIHIASAQRLGCPALETFDGPLITKGRDLDGIKIREPQRSKQPSLS